MPVAASAASSLALYDAMCKAIEAAHRVDEVKSIHDKALAMEFYAKQAKNTENERKACDVRLRAERKAGQLLKVMAKSKERARPGKPKTSRDVTITLPAPPATLQDIGISRNQSSRWQRLADVPEEKFEKALADPVEKPSTGRIIRENPKPAAAAEPKQAPIDKTLLWISGRLLDFEEQGILDRDPASMLITTTPMLLADIKRIAPKAARWLLSLAKEVEHAEA